MPGGSARATSAARDVSSVLEYISADNILLGDAWWWISCLIIFLEREFSERWRWIGNLLANDWEDDTVADMQHDDKKEDLLCTIMFGTALTASFLCLSGMYFYQA